MNLDLVFVSGPSRSGKTTIAKEYAKDKGGTLVLTGIQPALSLILNTDESLKQFLNQNGTINYNELLYNCEPSTNRLIHYLLFEHLADMVELAKSSGKPGPFVFDRHFIDIAAYSLFYVTMYEYTNVAKASNRFEGILVREHIKELYSYLDKNPNLGVEGSIIFTNIDYEMLAKDDTHPDKTKSGDIYTNPAVIKLLEQSFKMIKTIWKYR